MSWLQDIPVKRKLTLAILLTCSVALLLACGILAAYQVYDFRKAMVRNMTVLGDVSGKNARAALAFQDEKAARGLLQALQSESAVEGACLYAEDGTLFADYVRLGAAVDFPPQPTADGYNFARGHLMVLRPVVFTNGKRIGTIYLQADLQGVHERLVLFGSIAAAVLLGSLLVAFALSSWLQRPISKPILALAETARMVAEHKDFTLRATAQGKNEIGILTDAFNQMLVGIEERERALREEIVERKSAEDRVQAQLARLELLNQITRAIGSRLDLGGIFHVALKNLEEHLPVDFACVGICEAPDDFLRIFCIGSKSKAFASELDMREQTCIPVGHNGLFKCVHGQLIYEPDISRIEFPLPRRLSRAGLRSLVLAPLLVESKVFGVLFAARREPDSFSSRDCEFIRQLSEHVALAAHQAQLHTALQQAYDDLRQTQQAIMQQERLRALGQMASGIAHDINNAITPVLLYTETLLEKEANLSARARDYLETIQHAIGDVAQTVSRMREFYRQREPQLTLSPVSLNRVIQQVVDLSRARWNDMPQQRGVVIQMKMDLTDELPAIMGAESEIREALINLVFNAVDAMQGGGTLTLRTKVSKNDDSTPKHVQIEVADTGVGMDEDTRRRCLEPFFTTKGDRGTGLGLAMVYGIIQRHSAEIEIESEPHEGTTVRLIFPVTSPVFLDAVQPEATPAVPTRRRILVVDDDPLLIKSLRDTLESDGHVVVATSGGQAGIDAFQAAQKGNEPFGVVITDLGMPYVDGRQVARAVKEASPSTPVILLTGWGQRLVSEGDIPAHVDHVLSKPPKLSALRETLANCLPPSRDPNPE